jgi:hypothetical protein
VRGAVKDCIKKLRPLSCLSRLYEASPIESCSVGSSMLLMHTIARSASELRCLRMNEEVSNIPPSFLLTIVDHKKVQKSTHTRCSCPLSCSRGHESGVRKLKAIARPRDYTKAIM